MQTQLNYTIAQQLHTDLIRNAERSRLAASAGALRPARKPVTAITRFRGRITSVIAQALPSGTRQAL
jgi:hypothetical protein